MEAFLPAAALVALVYALINWAKALTNGDRNAAVTQVVVWAAGVAAVLLYAQTGWADQIVFGDLPLSAMSTWSCVAVGLAVGSAASAGYDAKRAVDSSDSAKTPPLLGGGPSS